MKAGKFLVDRVLQFTEEKGEFNVFPSPKCTRAKGLKYHGGVSVMATRGYYSAILEGSLQSGQVISLEVDAYKLHPEWKRMTPKRIKQFNEEMLNIEQTKIDIELNGGYHPDYSCLRSAV